MRRMMLIDASWPSNRLAAVTSRTWWRGWCSLRSWVPGCCVGSMVWGADGWLRTETGDGLPVTESIAPRGATALAPSTAAREHFDSSELPIDFQWLRSPWPDELFSLTERRGFLRLYGRETVGSLFKQALVARRTE